MKMVSGICLSLILTVAALGAVRSEVRQLGKANVLPLAIEDAFEFRKVKLFFNDPELILPTGNEMIGFERKRAVFGAVTGVDRKQREGHYFTFFWRARRQADLTVRLEYRQEKLGPFVLAKEIDYPGAKGSYKTDFQVIGDEYHTDGKVMMWRAVLIEDGKIVGLTHSYLWN